MFLYVSWTDSLHIHRMNKPYNFIVDFPKTLHLEGQWEVALMDIIIKSSKKSSFYLLADFCEESLLKGSQRTILRRVDNKNSHYSFPYYGKITKLDIQSIRVIALDQNLDFFQLTDIECILHLRKVNGD